MREHLTLLHVKNNGSDQPGYPGLCYSVSVKYSMKMSDMQKHSSEGLFTHGMTQCLLLTLNLRLKWQQKVLSASIFHVNIRLILAPMQTVWSSLIWLNAVCYRDIQNLTAEDKADCLS